MMTAAQTGTARSSQLHVPLSLIAERVAKLDDPWRQPVLSDLSRPRLAHGEHECHVVGIKQLDWPRNAARTELLHDGMHGWVCG